MKHKKIEPAAPDADAPDAVTVTENPANEPAKRGRKPSSLPTIGAFKAAVQAYKENPNAELPAWINLEAGHNVPSNSGIPRYIQPRLTSNVFYTVLDDGRAQAVSLTAEGHRYTVEVKNVGEAVALPVLTSGE